MTSTYFRSAQDGDFEHLALPAGHMFCRPSSSNAATSFGACERPPSRLSSSDRSVAHPFGRRGPAMLQGACTA
jgi:hypothetical protein